MKNKTKDYKNKEVNRETISKFLIHSSKIQIITICLFVLLCILSILNEILDFPHLFLNASRTPFNWRECLLEITLISIVASYILYFNRNHNRILRLREDSEEKLRNFIDATTIGIWCFKPELPIDISQTVDEQIDKFMESICVECNETYATMMGTQRDKVIGMKLSEVLPDCEETREYFREFIKGGYKLDGGETHEISKNGEEKYFSNSFVASITNNKLYQAWGIQIDITMQKQAEITLIENEQLSRTLIENSPIGISVRDKRGTLLLYNSAWQKLWGLSDKEVSKYHKPRKKLVFNNKDSYLGDSIDMIDKVYKNGDNYYLPEIKLTKNGKDKASWISQYFYALKDIEGNVQKVVIMTEDITRRKLAEEILNKELRKRQILQDVAMSLLETDLIISIKTSLKAIRKGLDLSKAILRIRIEPNNDIQIVDNGINAFGSEPDLPVNYRGVDARRAYEKREISIVNDVRKKEWYEKYKDNWEKTNTIAYLCIPCIDHFGNVNGILYLHDKDVRIWSDDDKNIGIAVAAELSSIIKRKQADDELKINRERLKTANTILRHDIANDILVIDSALNIYRDKQDDTMLDEIKKRVTKSLNTIQKQRDQELFIDSHATLGEYDLEKVALDCIKNYPHIKIDINGTGKVYADNAIYSVFENIISNAIKHGKTTKLNIDIRPNKEFCEIRFKDYGIGIPDDLKFKIFNEGFHYGETGNTGIGLYIVQQTIDNYGGKIFVEDNEPSGAVLTIYLRNFVNS